MKNRFDKLNKKITEVAETRGAELAKIQERIKAAEDMSETAKGAKAAAIQTESPEAYTEADRAEKDAASNIDFYKTILAKKEAAPVFNVSEVKSELARLYSEMTAEAQEKIAEHVNAIFDIITELRGEYIAEQNIVSNVATSAGMPSNALFVSDDKREIKTIMKIDIAMRRGFCPVCNLGMRAFRSNYSDLTAEQNMKYWAF
jgi:hypothetical protein